MLATRNCVVDSGRPSSDPSIAAAAGAVLALTSGKEEEEKSKDD
jgi:hypothetical protein